jgi:hypothetical protein
MISRYGLTEAWLRPPGSTGRRCRPALAIASPEHQHGGEHQHRERAPGPPDAFARLGARTVDHGAHQVLAMDQAADRHAQHVQRGDPEHQ